MIFSLLLTFVCMIVAAWALIFSTYPETDGKSGLLALVGVVFLLLTCAFCDTHTHERYLAKSLGSVIESGEADQRFFDQAQISIVDVREGVNGGVVSIRPDVSPYVVVRFVVSSEVAAKYGQIMRAQAGQERAEVSQTQPAGK